jgi:hypothetical protein
VISEELKNRVDNLSAQERDDIYRYLWGQHVKEDIRSHVADMDIELDDGDIEAIMEQYVYEGRYDCNLDYWANIGNLIDEYV